MQTLKEIQQMIYEGFASQLMELSNARNLPVEFKPWEEDNGGLHWSKEVRKIVLMGNLATENNLGTIVCWLHEMGHAIQFEGYETNRDYIRVHGNAETEVNAWEIAFDLAFELGFTKEQLEYMLRMAFHFCNTYWDEHWGNKWRDKMCKYEGLPMSWVEAEQRLHKACEVAMSCTV